MKDQRENGAPLLLPVLISVLMVWSTCNIYFSFADGELPLVNWKTEHRLTFGTLWTMATLLILYPIYLATFLMGLSISKIEMIQRDETGESPWFTSGMLSFLVVLVTFCVRVSVTSWFPSNMHLPFQMFYGGPVSGAISLLVSAGVMAFTLRLIRKISNRLVQK